MTDWFLINLNKIVIIALILIVLLILNGTITLNKPEENITLEKDNLIECFVDGKPIRATREDCIELSKKPTSTPEPAQPQTVQPQTRQQASALDWLNYFQNQSSTTNCNRNIDGSMTCFSY